MKKIVDHLPASVRELWAGLDSEVTQLHARWIIYRQLYGTSEERVDLLNESASSVFAALQDVWLHDVQLCLSKLDDPAGSGSRTNMTLEALHQALVSTGEAAAAAKLAACLPAFHAACGKIRHRRNKWIAHFDQATMLSADPRMSASRDEVETALEAVRDAMNAVSVHYADGGIAYEHTALQADGDALIYRLRQGLRYRELVQAGSIPWSDFHTRFNAGE
ncbi:hypothetical protein QTH91_14575 [Variovorax dokdonensis]|uniref:HEPN AbiU2-like domain-containing protein n=1 Tax=Variovorax dokdonensis TaxID=344883 RepID=A0ABT7NCQ5_9BURK|nr:hypothetical protein [Variovorax dokdonensis]